MIDNQEQKDRANAYSLERILAQAREAQQKEGDLLMPESWGIPEHLRGPEPQGPDGVDNNDTSGSISAHGDRQLTPPEANRPPCSKPSKAELQNLSELTEQQAASSRRSATRKGKTPIAPASQDMFAWALKGMTATAEQPPEQSDNAEGSPPPAEEGQRVARNLPRGKRKRNPKWSARVQAQEQRRSQPGKAKPTATDRL